MARINVIVSTVFALFAVAVIAATRFIPISPDMPLTKGSATFPLILSILIIALSGVLFLTNIGSYLSTRHEKQKPILDPSQLKTVSIGFLIILACAVLMALVGFIPSMIVLNGAFLLFFRVRKPLLIAAVSVATPIVVFVVFQLVLRIPLPSGVLFN